MTINSLFYLVVLYIIYNISNNISGCFEIEFTTTNNNNNRNNEMRFPRFNPFEEFLKMNEMTRQFMKDMNEIDDSDETTEKLEAISQDLEVAIKPKGHKKKKHKSKSIKSSANNVHTEVITTNENGIPSIQITEVHVGNTVRQGELGNINGMFAMGGPKIIITKSRNLKTAGGHASPFNMFKQIDDIFDTLFEDLAKTLIKSELGNDITNQITEISNKTKNDSKNNNDDNIIIKEVKDVTNTDMEDAQQTEAGSTLNDTQEVDKKLDSSISNSINKKEFSRNIDTQNNEDHSLAISYTNQAKSDDNVLTAKEKVKQIKNERRKSYFSKLCKYVFYCIILFVFYVVIKNLLALMSIIGDNQNIDDSNTSDKKGVLEMELKNSTIKKE